MMKPGAVIRKTLSHLKIIQSGESSGHDFQHTRRVWRMARFIGRREKADLFVVELAALLHDIADWKFNKGSLRAGPKAARAWLNTLCVPEETIRRVTDIIETVSFKGAGVADGSVTLEAKIVQDADRLDALGAIGVARTFAYGGLKGRELHNPQIKPKKHASFKSYRKDKGPTINHFYEKLLLLKARMHTKTAKQLAAPRHAFLKQFLVRFLKEWDEGC